MNTPGEIVYLDSMLNLAQSVDSIRWQCLSMSFMVRNYYNRMNPDSLMYWADKLDDLALENKFYKIFFDSYSLVCFWELYDKNYDSALDKANRLYQLAKDLDNANGMIASYEAIGLIYMETFRYVEAIKSYKEGLRLQCQQKNPRYAYQFQFMSYIIESYLKLKDYKGAEAALNEAYGLIEKCKANEVYFPVERCLWLLDCYNVEMYVALKMPEKAEAHIISANKYKDIDDFYVFCYYHLVSASYFQSLGDYNQALENVDKVLSETGDDYLPALKMKAELLLNAGKEQDAALLYYKSVNLIDSTYNESMSKQINQLRTIHEVDKLELKNQQIELENGRYKLTVTIVLVVVLFLAFVVILVHFIRVNRMKKLLEKSDKELKKDKEQLILSEKALSIAKEKAEASNRLKDVFLSNLSHEIRTPLNSIVGFTSLLGKMKDEGEMEEYVSIIKHNSDLLLKLVNDTVSVSLLQAEQISLEWEEIEIKQYCKKILDEYNNKVSSNVNLEFKASFDEFLLKTDKAQLKQILDNLLSNAVKFTEKGSVTLVCEIDEQSGNVRFIVEDTGCGIPKEKQDKIFESFEKVDSFIQGMGLGLTICKLVAERLGGTIVLDATYEKGTRMIFTHPL
ncbi:MAG: hypothetical protein IKY99_07360 [Bacteroidaceae bacterium]|nr:hypothetical protein [Bacteroidaceae bacterium]MBR5612681.1 hypothetical protein [Bacteroidaceae bacterium]